jgi:DNA-binding MarR family transcriptional regulator
MGREELIQRINREGRRMSTITTIFHQAVAVAAGLSGTDHKYLDLIMENGEMTSGELAEKTGLTSGAITGIVDRLEKQKLVKRRRDTEDRRKVFIVAQHENAYKKLGPVFQSLVDGFNQFYDQFSDEELVVIEKYLRESSDFFKMKTEDLKAL